MDLSVEEELHLREKMREVLVRDTITECAINQLAFELKERESVTFFTQKYCPGLLTGNNTASEMGQESWSSQQETDPSCEEESLSPLLQRFLENLNAPEPTTGISNHDYLESGTTPDLVSMYAQLVCEAALEGDEESWDLPRLPINFFNPEPITATGGLAQLQDEMRTVSAQEFEATKSTLARFSRTLEDSEAQFLFCVGGSVELERQLVLRFESVDEATRKVIFGPDISKSTKEADGIDVLLKACEPATFGLGGKDILDKSYRDASKLDPANFSLNFHPADHGILDEVSRIMLPRTSKFADMPMLRCELYMLNIYSSGGKFRSHVDTPRSSTQFGSLVVSLPSYHSGGQLHVRHNNQAMEYDWGHSKNVEWAAFYSDCEHEVCEVTEGHRVTLTYNLHWHTPQSTNTVRLEDFPLYVDMQQVLKLGTFFPLGGTVGFYCKYAYPRHRDAAKYADIATQLKGIDRTFYVTLQALGLDAQIRPVLEQSKVRNEYQEYQEYNECFSPLSENEGEHEDRKEISQRTLEEYNNDRRSGLLEYYQQMQRSGGALMLDYDDEYDSAGMAGQGFISFRHYLAVVLSNRYIRGLPLPPNSRTKGEVDRVGLDFGEVKLGGGPHEGLDEKFEMLDEDFPIVRGIHWLNQPQNEEIRLAYIAYGNEARLDHYYSSAAILFSIPPYNKRRGSPETDNRRPTEESSASGNTQLQAGLSAAGCSASPTGVD